MTRRKLALTVGINQYGGSANLNGCVNDALTWTDLLAGQGYETNTLLDGQATKAAVIADLRYMVDTARFGDRIVFTYSGHGSWVPDVNGDEVDGRDECLVLADYRSGGLLADDELDAIFRARRFGVRVVVISDSCHSGTLHRFAGMRIPGEAEGAPWPKARFLPPAEFLPPEHLAAARRVEHDTPRGTSRPTTALMSGCDDPGFSYDAWIGGRYRGAFTAAATSAWRPGITLAAWHRAIREVLPSDRYPQSPQLQATSSQRRWAL